MTDKMVFWAIRDPIHNTWSTKSLNWVTDGTRTLFDNFANATRYSSRASARAGVTSICKAVYRNYNNYGWVKGYPTTNTRRYVLNSHPKERDRILAIVDLYHSRQNLPKLGFEVVEFTINDNQGEVV